MHISAVVASQPRGVPKNKLCHRLCNQSPHRLHGWLADFPPRRTLPPRRARASRPHGRRRHEVRGPYAGHGPRSRHAKAARNTPHTRDNGSEHARPVSPGALLHARTRRQIQKAGGHTL